MKKLILFISAALFASCADDNDTSLNSIEGQLPSGTITVSYSGKTVTFENPEMMVGGPDSPYDLTVSGYIKFEEQSQLKHYIRLPFNSVDGQYVLEQIDINDNQWLTETHFDIVHHFVMLEGEFDDPNFVHNNAVTADNHLTGSFSGTLIPGLQEPEGTPSIYINGSYDLDLDALEE